MNVRDAREVGKALRNESVKLLKHFNLENITHAPVVLKYDVGDDEMYDYRLSEMGKDIYAYIIQLSNKGITLYRSYDDQEHDVNGLLVIGADGLPDDEDEQIYWSRETRDKIADWLLK